MCADIFNESPRIALHGLLLSTCLVMQGQAAVYSEVSGLVSGVMNGINACVLAYGRKGSGKAHVLAGTPNEPGINFRATSQMIQ